MNQEMPARVILVHGFHKNIIRGLVWIRLLQLALKEYKSIGTTFKAVKQLSVMRRDIAGKNKFNRFIKANGKYYWHFYLPGYPSRIFDNHYKSILNRIVPVNTFNHRLASLFVSLTNSCPLSCRHCYAVHDLNKPGELAAEDLKEIIHRFQEVGVSRINFLGGEPMARFGDLITLTGQIKDRSEVWISTCGYKLDQERAIALKKAGLTGLAISIDHFDARWHNDFRGNINAFDWAINATKNGIKAGLIICWSICVSKEFISRDNLMKYLKLAASFKVHFMQIFEPMNAGNYEGKDIGIDPKHIHLLEDFYLQVNRKRTFREYPLVIYPGYHHRRIGCLGSGKGYVYIDAFGKMHPCPFCNSKQELEPLAQPIEMLLEQLRGEKCHYG